MPSIAGKAGMRSSASDSNGITPTFDSGAKSSRLRRQAGSSFGRQSAVVRQSLEKCPSVSSLLPAILLQRMNARH
jgi:hypothetical protein